MKPNKQKILDAASTLFLKGGAGALSVRAIASQAGLSTIGIYSHFDGKQGVLDTLYIEGFELVSEATHVVDDGGPALAAILQASRNYLQLAESHQAHYRLIFGNSEGDYKPSDAAREVGAKAFASLTAVIARVLPARANKKTKQDAAVQIWSLLHGSVSLRHHAVAELVEMAHWQQRVLDAVEILVKGLSRR